MKLPNNIKRKLGEIFTIALVLILITSCAPMGIGETPYEKQMRIYHEKNAVLMEALATGDKSKLTPDQLPTYNHYLALNRRQKEQQAQQNRNRIARANHLQEQKQLREQARIKTAEAKRKYDQLSSGEKLSRILGYDEKQQDMFRKRVAEYNKSKARTEVLIKENIVRACTGAFGNTGQGRLCVQDRLSKHEKDKKTTEQTHSLIRAIEDNGVLVR